VDKAAIWRTIDTERGSLATDLGPISEEQWNTLSQCNQWSVRDVLAHMTATAKTTSMNFLPGLVGTGFKFNELSDKKIREERGASSAETLARFKAIETSRKRPPGPIGTMLGETIVHAEDIRGPLGIAHEYPGEALIEVADFYKGSNLILHTKSRIDGLSLRATDASWSHGSGPEVAGPMLALVMAMVGRKQPLDRLSGDGVATLRGRRA